MAFSFRKIISNIPYFHKPEDDNEIQPDSNQMSKKRRHISTTIEGTPTTTDTTPSTSEIKTSSNENAPLNKVITRSSSLSETDLHKIETNPSQGRKILKRIKKRKPDVNKANKSTDDVLNMIEDYYGNRIAENTPERLNIAARSAEIFSERLKEFDLNKSVDIFELMCEDQVSEDDLKSLSDNSDSDTSIESHEGVQMCRKVKLLTDISGSSNTSRASSVESFADVEFDKNEDERITLLLSYQMKLEKIERLIKKLFTEFQFHIEVSKIFHSKSTVTTLPGFDVNNIPKILGEITYIDNLSRGASPIGSWNIVMEKEDHLTKYKLQKQLMSIKHCIEEFIKLYLQKTPDIVRKPSDIMVDYKKPNHKSITYGESKKKHLKINSKKRDRRLNSFPDWRESFLNLFNVELENQDSILHESNVTDIHGLDVSTECHCECHIRNSSPNSQTDSGRQTKTGDDKSNQSITSSLGNFTLDSSSLSAYSESLDNIISYNSFHDTSLYTTLLQKAAIERITFYVQVHGIQLKNDTNESDLESKNIVTFNCHSCSVSEKSERDLLKHIFTQKHCEKIHFLYKTSYIKKCMMSGKEILPSTILNPMTMYRDQNKIVCFGDGMYACSLCFENMIVGESVLIAHCASSDHVERRTYLTDILD